MLGAPLGGRRHHPSSLRGRTPLWVLRVRVWDVRTTQPAAPARDRRAGPASRCRRPLQPGARRGRVREGGCFVAVPWQGRRPGRLPLRTLMSGGHPCAADDEDSALPSLLGSWRTCPLLRFVPDLLLSGRRCREVGGHGLSRFQPLSRRPCSGSGVPRRISPGKLGGPECRRCCPIYS